MIHIDDLKLTHFSRVVHRNTGNRQQGHSTGIGYDLVHDAINDATSVEHRAKSGGVELDLEGPLD